ncbi:MAG: PIN domain-containing protein [Ignavibacteriae bacterium]|nr:PIN domain-containing protein [Ignavibacteriota bacterium]
MTLREELIQAGKIFIDTSPFIYFVEAHPKYGLLAKEIFDTVQAGDCKAYSSVVTLTEVLPKPLQVGNNNVVKKFKEMFVSTNSFSIVDITYSIAERAGMLRGKYTGLKTVDALQLSGALAMNVNVFITNDKQLKQINEITILVLDDYMTKPIL